MRHTRGHTRNRRSHHALDSIGSILCANCGQPQQKHLACKHCGQYKGNDVLEMGVKADKKQVADKAKKSTRSK